MIARGRLSGGAAGWAAPRTAKEASLKRVWESMMITDEVVEELFRIEL